jgi:hypothetical protein
MTWKENPITVSISFLICFALFIPVFIAVGIEIIRKS